MICIDRTITLLPELLSPLEPIHHFDAATLSAEELRRCDCTALFFRSTLRVTRALLEGTGVKFLGSLTSGVDHIEEAVLNDPALTVATARGANANAVAEYVLASILLWCRLRGHEPAGATIGIVGFGNIGRRVAEYACALGMRILVNDPPLAEQDFAFPSFVEHVPLPRLVAVCDVLTNHVPLVIGGRYATKNLLSEELLQSCPAELIIHTSRGGVVSERGLLHALERGALVAIDVWEQEPDCLPAIVERALLATPHVAGHTLHARIGAALMVARAYCQWRNLNVELSAPALPARQQLRERAPAATLLTRLLSNRPLDGDTERMREIAPLPHEQRLAALQHFRATYPLRPETFCTTYDAA